MVQTLTSNTVSTYCSKHLFLTVLKEIALSQKHIHFPATPHLTPHISFHTKISLLTASLSLEDVIHLSCLIFVVFQTKMEGIHNFLLHLFSTDGSVQSVLGISQNLLLLSTNQAEYNENEAGFHLLLGEKVQRGKKLTQRCM